MILMRKLVICKSNDNGNLPLTVGRKYYDYSPISEQCRDNYLVLTDICRLKAIPKSYFKKVGE